MTFGRLPRPDHRIIGRKLLQVCKGRGLFCGMQASRHDSVESRWHPSFGLSVFGRIKCQVSDFACKALAASKQLSIENQAGSQPNIQKEETKIALANPL